MASEKAPAKARVSQGLERPVPKATQGWPGLPVGFGRITLCRGWLTVLGGWTRVCGGLFRVSGGLVTMDAGIGFFRGGFCKARSPADGRLGGGPPAVLFYSFCFDSVVVQEHNRIINEVL